MLPSYLPRLTGSLIKNFSHTRKIPPIFPVRKMGGQPVWHGTTIVVIRKDNKVVIGLGH